VILHLGVADIPYANEAQPKRDKVAAGTQTTGDVAGWLEDRYHIMEIFFHEHEDAVAKAMEGGLAGSLESLLTGAPATTDVFGEGANKIRTLFMDWLSSGAIEHLGIPGVPTMAALKGISHRFKRKRGPRRPSFIDTSTYEDSFIDWVD
jgi:hypothetical protein